MRAQSPAGDGPRYVLVYPTPLREAIRAAGVSAGELLAALAERGLAGFTVVDVALRGGEPVYASEPLVAALCELLDVTAAVLSPLRHPEPEAAVNRARGAEISAMLKAKRRARA